MGDDQDDREAPRMLHRIAATLNLPTETFYADSASGLPPSTGATDAEEARQRQGLDILRLFLALDDQAARDRCLAYVRRELARRERADR